MIIYATDSKKVKWPKLDSHDPDSEKYYGISYYPESRANSTSYTKDVDLVVTSVNNGCMYACTSGGVSASAEPTIPTVENNTFADGDVEWKCLPLTTVLGVGDIIDISTWTGDTGVTFTLPTINGGIATEVKVTAIPANVSSFTITNEFEVLYATGKREKRQKSLIITVEEL